MAAWSTPVSGCRMELTPVGRVLLALVATYFHFVAGFLNEEPTESHLALSACRKKCNI